MFVRVKGQVASYFNIDIQNELMRNLFWVAHEGP